jgi:hypothetical protein
MVLKLYTFPWHEAPIHAEDQDQRAGQFGMSYIS